MSRKHLTSIIILLMTYSLSLYSQDQMPSLSDGEVTDSTFIRQNHFSHYFVTRCIFNKPYSYPSADEFSGKLQLLDVSDYDTYLRVVKSVSLNARQDNPHDMPLAARIMLVMVQLACKSPGDCPEGYMRLSQTSGPLRNMYMKIPGHAPDVMPLWKDNAPSCVKLEYDSSNGRYKEALVEWKAVQK